jgi:parallel beta-helix repeat protein
MRFDGSGVLLSGTKSDIAGNYIGTNAAGTAARGNGVGVTVTGDSNGVGGSFDRRNVISGNETDGILINGASSTSVAGNYIGTTKSGTSALGNGGAGVYVLNAPYTFIGGSLSENRLNVISANGNAGIRIEDSADDNHGLIAGNRIGTDASGMSDLGNISSGVSVGANGVTVGSVNPDFRNVISGNGHGGLVVTGSDITVQGNFVGTNASGSAAVGNDLHGVFLSNAHGNTIGGSGTGERNVISGNGIQGLLLSSSNGNTVQGNLVGTKSDGTGNLGNSFSGVVLSGTDDNLIGGQ